MVAVCSTIILIAALLYTPSIMPVTLIYIFVGLVIASLLAVVAVNSIDDDKEGRSDRG